MAVEAKRGCGYRKVGGLYLVGGGLSAPCDRMPFLLERCKVCGGGIKFTRGPQWILPEFFPEHVSVKDCACEHGSMGGPCSLCDHKHPIGVQCSAHGATSDCRDDSPCPVCNRPALGQEFGPHLLLWIGRGHYTPEAYLTESRQLGVSRRLSAMPKGLVLGETWVLLAHLDAVPPREGPDRLPMCATSGCSHAMTSHEVHAVEGSRCIVSGCECRAYEKPKSTPGIFCAFIPRAVELILKQSDATPERIEKEEKRGVTVVAVPDDDKDHQGSVWSKEDEEDSQPELPGVSP